MDVLVRRNFGKEIEALRRAIDDLAGCDAFALADADSVIELSHQRNRLDGVTTKVVAEFDAGGEWVSDGAKTASAWLWARCHLPKAEAQRLVRRGKALSPLAVAAEAFFAGEIGAAQFDALAKVRTPVTEAALARDEALLVGFAKELKFEPFVTRLAYWLQCADPDGAEESDMERRARRDVYLAPSVSGMFLGGITLDPISGSVVYDELVRLEKVLFEGDWAEAKERLGKEPKLHELRRTSAQRRADALVEMARRSKEVPEDGRRADPLVTILVGYETLYGRICQLANGTVIAPGSIFEWLDGATFERIVFAPGTRIECSPKSRIYTGATRRAVEVRDLQCTHEYCDQPADKCQIDHIVPWTKGGLTTQENGQVHCGFHNRLRHHGPPEPGDHGPPESGGHGPEPGD
jgi:hypothetical protein